MHRILTFNLDYNDYITISCGMNGSERMCTYLVDTQADISVFKNSSITEETYIDAGNVIRIRGVTQDYLQSLGTVGLSLFIDNDQIDHEFHVVPDEFNIDCDGIIGKDFLMQYRCKIDYD